MPTSSFTHGARRHEAIGPWVEDLGRLQVLAIVSAEDQHPPIGEKGRRVSGARLAHLTDGSDVVVARGKHFVAARGGAPLRSYRRR